jgi:predicted metal-binding membrane protein
VRAGLEQLLRHDRAVVAAGLLSLAAAAWVSLLRARPGMGGSGAGADAAMPGMSMPGMHAWSALDLLPLFLMWATMMVAMMLPSAAPMILLVASVHRRRRERASPAAPTALFVAGYLLVWTAFSAVAALAQWGLHGAALLSPAMASTSSLFSGVVLIIAGAYQWLPVKSACLSHCRSPLGFLGSEWREGMAGTVVMGLKHGLFCLGCCWALMAVLFVAGVMNPLGVAAIAGVVLIEKIAPVGPALGKVAGVALIAGGAWMLMKAL